MKISGIFKTALPWITTALTEGPVGVATMAMGHVGKALGIDPPKTAEAAVKALEAATPEQIIALKAEDHSFSLRMKELDIQEVADLERIAAADRDSARHREIQVRDWTPKVIAIAILAFAFACEFMVLRFGYPANVPGEAIGRILATQDALALAVVYYYFGSSSGSHKKDQTIANISSE